MPQQSKNTVVLKVSPDRPGPGAIRKATAVLRAGGIVAFPTETVYGLGADVFNPDAVVRIFQAKGRPPDNPLIVHIARIEQLNHIVKHIPPPAQKLTNTFWPGPLTLILERKSIVPDIVTAGLDTVAVRMPKHNVPMALINELSHGIVGPSANTSGRPSPTTAEHVYSDLNGRIEMILDAGPTKIGLESTVIDFTTTPPALLRSGGLTREQVEQVIGRLQTTKKEELLKRSPGTRHRHYAPRAKVILIEHGNVDQFQYLYKNYHQMKKKVGSIIHSKLLLGVKPSELCVVLPSQIEEYSRHLFASLRKLDSISADIILVETVPEIGLGVAVMDRLRRAAEEP